MKKEIINKIKELKSKGLNPKEIAAELNIQYQKVKYHTDEEYRQRAIDRAIKYHKENKRIPNDKYRKYQREYQGNKYRNDEEFRQKQRDRSFKYYQLKSNKIIKALENNQGIKN